MVLANASNHLLIVEFDQTGEKATENMSVSVKRNIQFSVEEKQRIISMAISTKQNKPLIAIGMQNSIRIIELALNKQSDRQTSIAIPHTTNEPTIIWSLIFV